MRQHNKQPLPVEASFFRGKLKSAGDLRTWINRASGFAEQDLFELAP